MTTFTTHMPPESRDKTAVPCNTCGRYYKRADLKWHMELVHNANSEARWLARQGQGEGK